MGETWCLIIFEDDEIIGIKTGSFETLWPLFERVCKKKEKGPLNTKEFLETTHRIRAIHDGKEYVLINTSKVKEGFPPRIEPYNGKLIDEFSQEEIEETGYIIRYREIFYQDYWVESKNFMSEPIAKMHLEQYLKRNEDFIESEFERPMDSDDWSVIHSPPSPKF